MKRFTYFLLGLLACALCVACDPPAPDPFTINPPEGIQRALSVGASGNLYSAGGDGNGFWIYDGGKWTHIVKDKPCKIINAITELSVNNVLVGCDAINLPEFDSGLWLWHDGVWEQQLYPVSVTQSLPIPTVFSIYSDTLRLMVTTQEGVFESRSGIWWSLYSSANMSYPDDVHSMLSFQTTEGIRDCLGTVSDGMICMNYDKQRPFNPTFTTKNGSRDDRIRFMIPGEEVDTGYTGNRNGGVEFSYFTFMGDIISVGTHFIPSSTSASPTWVQGLFLNKDTLWLADGEQGVFSSNRINKADHTEWVHHGDVEPTNAIVLYQGVMVAATNNGLKRYQP